MRKRKAPDTGTNIVEEQNGTVKYPPHKKANSSAGERHRLQAGPDVPRTGPPQQASKDEKSNAQLSAAAGVKLPGKQAAATGGKHRSGPPPAGAGPGGMSSNWQLLKATMQQHQRKRPGNGSHSNERKAPPPSAGEGGAASEASHHNHGGGGSRPLNLGLPRGTSAVHGGLTKVAAMDCEMVGVGVTGARSILARVCIVNAHGNVVYDKFVAPLEKVTDYRTFVSGVRASDLRAGRDHGGLDARDTWLQVLLLSHPKKDIRDTYKYRPLRELARGSRKLKHIAERVLGAAIQAGEHCPADDARAALYVYYKLKKEWEQSLQPAPRLGGALREGGGGRAGSAATKASGGAEESKLFAKPRAELVRRIKDGSETP
eukprot:jgi/Mesen1/9213/ME000591S08536